MRTSTLAENLGMSAQVACRKLTSADRQTTVGDDRALQVLRVSVHVPYGLPSFALVLVIGVYDVPGVVSIIATAQAANDDLNVLMSDRAYLWSRVAARVCISSSEMALRASTV